MASEPGWIRTSEEEDCWVVSVGGHWDVAAAELLEREVADIAPPRDRAAAVRRARIDMEAVDALDASGAWLVHRAKVRLEAAGLAAHISGAKPAHRALLERVERAGEAEVAPPPRSHPFIAVLDRCGRGAVGAVTKSWNLLGFFGLTVFVALRVLARPGRIRFTSFVSHVEQTGLNALPIVGLLSFLVGVVIAFQGADQLRRFGAEVFTVDMLGVSILRELGILITAIVVAGRSGSAFTAQIGTMKVNQEVDAMRTLGLDPIEILVLPRIFALVVTLPLLSFYANGMALLGGALMSLISLDISLNQFLSQLAGAVTLTTFWLGMVKAPVFAFLIALVGCFEGLQVEGSAESVGRLTTTSVVEAIFLVIVFDALFSILFSYLGL